MEERTYGKMEWLFYIIILPLLFTSLIVGLVLQFMGYNVSGKLMSIARHTPVLSSIVPPDEATKKELSEINRLQAQLDEATKVLDEVQKKNETLQQDLGAKDSELMKLLQKIDAEKKQAGDRQAAAELLKTKARIYSEMSPKNAAAIISKLPPGEAREVLGAIKPDIRASILEKMDPQIAAALESGDAAPTGETSPFSTDKAKMYGSMSPAKAAAILAQVPVPEARAILAGMNAETRALILEKMDPKMAAQLESDQVTGQTGAGVAANKPQQPQQPQKPQTLYTQMSPDKAAAILTELPFSEAKTHLNAMSTDQKAQILAKMDPKLAARFETMEDYSSRLSDSYWRDKARFYESMEADQAAKILKELPVAQARAILQRMDSWSRIDILKELDPQTAAKLLER